MKIHQATESDPVISDHLGSGHGHFRTVPSLGIVQRSLQKYVDRVAVRESEGELQPRHIYKATGIYNILSIPLSLSPSLSIPLSIPHEIFQCERKERAGNDSIRAVGSQRSAPSPRGSF